ncbi:MULTISPECIES: helix-turn-helix domain-containing protein [unclassified Microbacterium]|uniref:helix-turn-helix domain-containing protein n=1 Tax=unclassified Microbacterium TaxID=2609290 RepID=UPI0006F99431|nr:MULTISPECIES: helix-turn-helix transcriptional regulator [unclassified Microbacterium]KQR88908.1 XRE family transcriptional regulator [Microbacterium sp. Leaf179]KQT74042.1 XRE family transcriptional regulator [Microbacterium sp. Leaf436]MBD8206307.1 helix-turn-helix transcriptional regulator [Microbacterium sp. CFBP 8801]MBD8478242.1 helix-turn-helix transcriptional regulator [Microbacterium sp. CFBP 8794]MBD8508497.1 helix-turn-helix transcriptional regulator [Microbacterium sp. CFBP 8790
MTDAPDPWNDFVRELGVRLLRARADKRMSQEQVAHAAGLATFTYRKLEKGESNPGTAANPRLRTLVALAEVLEVPLRDLLPTPPEGLAPGR